MATGGGTRIVRVDVHPIALPLVHPYRDSTRVETHSRDVFVRVTAADGAVGWGATAPRRFPTGDIQRATVAVLEEVLAPSIASADPRDVDAIHARMDEAIAGNYAAKAAIDIAVHDLVGRMTGRPVHDLLGGRLRPSMPTLDILPLDLPERMADNALDLRERVGTRAFKVKIDADVETGLRRVAAVRAALGDDATIVVDANGAWTVDTAVTACEALADYGVAVVEQPTPGNDLDALAAVRDRSPIPIAADESVRPEFVDRLLATHAADIVNVKLTREGGLAPSRSVAGAARDAGLEVVCGSVVQSGLIDAACAHFFASTPAIAYNESGKSATWHREDVTAPLRVADGQVHVPSGPGLGVEVDPAAVARFRPTD